MAVYPNNECQLFCYWMLNVSWQALTTPRLTLINTVYNAAITNTSVSDNDFNNFTKVTSWRYPYFTVWLNNGGQPSLESILYFNAWSTQPSSTFKDYINTFISSLKSSGNWVKLKALWLTATPTQDGALINMIQPQSPSASLISTPTFTSNQGFSGASSTKAINLNYTPSFSDNLNQNYMEFGSYNRLNIAETACTIGNANASQTNGNYIFPKRAGGTFDGGIGGTGTSGVTVTDSLALSSVKRSNSALIQTFQRGVLKESSTNAPNGFPRVSMYGLAQNNNGTIAIPCTNQIALWYISEPTINTLSLYNSIQSLMTSIGCNV